MAEYSIGEVERLTGLKAHVLRYWEEVIPFIRPRKDDQGRRYYGDRDVELIERVKYLVQERKYTLEGAGERLVAELTDARMIRARETAEAVRTELAEIYAIVRKRKDVQ
ncbi:MAG TPA: MerR family transcriptional regulator [Treponemataceae bacterium]|nr:MerR family transcriptional regulator [Treponemataceae bacterium]